MKKSFFLLASLLFLMPGVSLQAQEAAPTGESVTAVLAEVGVRNCTMAQKEREVSIACDFVNGKGIQPDVRYSVKLIREDGENRAVLDEKVYEETLVLREGGTLHKDIAYTIPGFLQGPAELWVTASNSEGLGMGSSMTGTVNATALDGHVEIVPSTCSLTVVGETDKRYHITQGVDVDTDEFIRAYCDVRNPGRLRVVVKAGFETYRRTLFGEKAEASDAFQPVLSVGAGETKNMYFDLPKAFEPQAYDAAFTLFSPEGERISNTVPFHYVVRGAAATVQNVSLDKDYYEEGAKAIVKASWTGSPDQHRLRRAAGTDEQAQAFSVRMTDGAGVLCAEATKAVSTKEIDRLMEESFELTLTQECVDPTVVVQVTDKAGKILGEKTVSVKSENVETKLVGKPFSVRNLLIGFVAILFILSLGLILWKGRKPRRSVSSFIFLLFAFSYWVSAPSVEAASLQNVWDLNLAVETICVDEPLFGGQYCYESGGGNEIITTNFVVDINKTTYAPGEDIFASGKFVDAICADGAWLGALLDVRNDADSQSASFSWVHSQAGTEKQTTLKAPTTPGNYTVTFNGGSNGVGENCVNGRCQPVDATQYKPSKTSVAIPYTVVGGSSCAANQGQACSSTANVCGQASTGTIACDGSCSAGAAPADPADFCPFDAGFQCPGSACISTGAAVSGTCGAANQVPVSTSPTAGLCDQGTATAVNGTGPWNWSCTGSNGGATASCSAPYQEPAPFVDLKINGSDGPLTVAQGSNLNLIWAVANATSCSGFGSGWSGAKAIGGGNENVSAAIDQDYTISCTGPGGMATDIVKVIISKSLKICENTCSSDINPPSFTMTTGQTKNLVACWNPVPGCTDSTGNVTSTASWNDGGTPVITLSGTDPKVINATGAGTEPVSASYSGQTVSKSVTVTCTDPDACLRDSRSQTLCSADTFTVVDACGVSQTCSGSKSCDFNWKEVAP